MARRLLERDQELAALAALLEESVTGQGRVAVISGEAGIGKTALVEHVIAHAPPGVRALWGACEALFAPRPLGPLFDIAQQLPPTIRALLDGDTRRATLFAAVLEDLRTKPTILVIEDLHWADEATLDLIKYLARRITQTKTLLLLTYRDDELDRHHPLRLVLGDLPTREVTRLRLLPLSREAVTQLAKKSAHPAHELQELYAATSGNPFFVTEILASDTAQALLSVSDAVLARVARRSREAQRLLEVVAVSPGRIERWVVAALGADEEAPLDECLAAGLLQLDGQMLSFRHELARQAVEGALSPARRQALNTHVLHALLESEVAPAAPARLAHHAIQTEDAALVLRFTPEAARQAAARGARREAIAHYQTALRYTAQLAPEQQAGLLDEVSYELSLTGHIADAVQTCEAALAIWRALDQRERVGHGLRHLASLNSYLARNAEAERHGVAAIALLETLSPGRELASAYATLSRLRMVTSDTAQTIVWGERAIALAEQLADHETVSAALTSMGSSELCAGDEGGRAKLERSLAIALEHGFEQQVGLAYFNLTQICVTHRAFAQAEIYLQAGMAYCGEHELDIASQRLRADLAHLRLSQGDWAGADEQVSSILRLPVLSTGNRIRPLTVLGLVRARRGDPGAETVLDELRDLALATGELICIAPMAAARAEWRWLRGDHAGCAAEAQVGVQAAAHRHRPWYLGEVAIWLWRGGGAGTALDELDDLDEVALPFALEMAGDWRGAADRWAQLGCPYEQALALLDGDEAAQREALTIFERLGARPAAEITRQRLRQAGARGLPRGPRPATRANPLGLTPRQLEILLLVATGLRNGEIAERLSTTSKTVEHHLTDILAKLNARSRLEAVSIAAASGLLPPRVTTPSRP